MLFRTSLKQTLRMPVKLLSYFLVNALAAALLCVGLNMERSAQDNLAAAEDCFTTIAVPEIWKLKSLLPDLTAEELIEYWNPETNTIEVPPEKMKAVPLPDWATEAEYDLAPLRDAPGVMRIDLRGRFGAYVNTGEHLNYGIDADSLPGCEDVIIFTFDGEEPLIAPSEWGVQGEHKNLTILLTVLRSANQLYQYENEITLGPNDISPYALDASVCGCPAMFDLGEEYPEGSFRLEPGKQYIATLSWVMPQQIMEKGGNVISSGAVQWAMLSSDAYHNPRNFSYREVTGKQSTLYGPYLNTMNVMQYLPIAEYYDGFFDTEEGTYYKEASDACAISSNSLTAITTNDLSAMHPFHSGNVHISEGRAFTETEYASGAKVCLVSAAMAELNSWKIGDTLSLSFYDCPPEQYNDCPDNPNPVYEWHYSAYTKDSSGFFDEGEFTIVGMFDGRVEKSQRKQYNSTTDKLHMVNVIIPEASVQNAPEPRIYKYTSSIRLENSKAIDFITAMQASGLMDSAEGEYGSYELRLTVYDQGYSLVAPGLNQLSRVSRLTLLLSAAAAGLAVFVLAVIHVLRMRREIAAMRSLGTKKRQIMAIALSGVLLVCLIGAAVGACAGHVLSAEVTERVLASAEADAADTTFTAMMGEETAKEFTFELESEPRLALAAGGAVVAVFAVFAALLLAAELQKPPMAQLGVKE